MILKNLLKTVCYTSLTLGFFLNAHPLSAFTAEDVATEAVNAVVSIAKGTALEDSTLTDAAFKTAEMRIVNEISTQIINAIIKTVPNLSDEFAISIFQDKIATAYARKVGSLGSSFAGQLAADVIVGIVVDIAADEVKETFGGEGSFSGEMAAFAVKQTRVAWAAKRGPHAAVLESAILTGEQLYRVVELKNELEGIKEKNAIGEAIVNSRETVADLRIEYKTAPPSEKSRIELQIRQALTESLVYDPGLFSSEKPIPHSNAVIDQFILAMKSADQSKHSAAEAIYLRIKNAHPDQLDAYIKLANEFIENNFYDPAKWGGSSEDTVNPAKNQRRSMYAAVKIIEDRAQTDTARLRSLIQEARQIGGTSNLSVAKQNLMIALAKGIDSSLNPFGKQEVLNRIFVNFNNYAEKYNGDPIDFSTIIVDPIIGTNPPADDDTTPIEDDTSGTDPVEEENNSDRTDENTIIIGEGEEPTGPTDEEIAAQISALEIERTAQFEVKVDREANIANNNDRLAILEHGELGTVQNALSLVVSRVNDMRQDLIDGNLTAAEQQVFQDLAAYQETLEGEIDRINTEITTLTNTNQTLQSELDSADNTIISNSNQLNALNYDYNNFTEPTFTGTLTDWSNYEYELPPFNETETPTENLVGVFSGVNYGTNGTTGSNLAIQGVLTNITETSTGNANFEITGDCVSDCTVTGTPPEPEASSYQHLSWGRLSQTVRMTDTNTGITHDIQQMRWLYGDATSSDYLNTRTGTASYAGQIYADFTEAGVTQYNAVTGGIGLSFNFSDDSLSGQAYFSMGGVPQEGFNIAGGLVSFDGQQYLRADLTSQDPDTSGSITSGGLLGTFYGPEASEVGGAIWAFGTASQYDDAFAVGGVFVSSSGETFVMPDIYYGDTHTRVSSSTTPNAAGTVVYGASDTAAANVSGNTIALAVGGEVTKTETFSANGYSYSSWGKWTAPTNGNAHTGYAQSGYWSETQTTPASVVQNRTGTASYSGNIVGDFVTSAGVRDDARGLININADFSNQSVSGQFQFGHDCGGGSGPSGCNVVSGVASFNEAINDYNGSGFGSHSNTVNTAGSGVVGIFAGPNAEEIAGTAWMNDNGGLYNGAFIAGQ